MINEPRPFEAKWYSHKFNGPGIRYEVGISIYRGWISWVSGPYPCGSWSDVSIFRRNLKKLLRVEEIAIADGGYRDYKCVKNYHRFGNEKSATFRARHETANGRLKKFNSVGGIVRYRIHKHGLIMHAVARICQMEITYESPLFEMFV